MWSISSARSPASSPCGVLARLRSIPDYVPVESDAQVLIDYDNGAAGIFWTSFAMVGKSCCMKVRIYGDKGGMEWERPRFHGAPGGHRRTAHPDLVGQL